MFWLTRVYNQTTIISIIVGGIEIKGQVTLVTHLSRLKANAYNMLLQSQNLASGRNANLKF